MGIKIPRDVTAIRAALKAAHDKREKEKTSGGKTTDDVTKQREIVQSRNEEKRKAKEASANLDAAQKLLSEKDDEIAALKLSVDAVSKERDEFAPMAKLWKNYEHVERTRLIAGIPPELKKDAQDMSLAHLRLFAGKTVGKESESKGTDKNAPADLDALSKLTPKEINANIDKILKGEMKAPTMMEAPVV